MPIVTNGWMDQDDIWYGGLGPGNLVLDGNPAHSSHTPEFSAHVCCGQTAGWIRMPLRMEVGLGQGHIVLDGDPVPEKWGYSAPRPPHCVRWRPGSPTLPHPQKGGGAQGPLQIFDPCLLWPNGRMDQDATRYGGKPWPRRHCVRWESLSPNGKGHSSTPYFGPCLLWPNCHTSQQILQRVQRY